MSKEIEVDLKINSNVEGSIAQLKALKKELKNTAAGSEDFKKLYNEIDDLEDKIKSAKKTSSDWIDSLEQAGGPIGALGASLNRAKVATQSFGGALKATGIGLVVSLVAGLAAAFNDNASAQKKLQPLLDGLSKIFQGVFRAVEPLFNTLVDLAVSALPTVSKAFGVVYSSLVAVLTSLGSLGSAIKKLISGDFSGAWEEAKKSVTGFSKTYNDSNKRFIDGTKEVTKKTQEELDKRKEAEAKHQKDLQDKRDEASRIAKEKREAAAKEEAEFQIEHQKFLSDLDVNAFAGKLAKGKEQADIQQAQNTEISLNDATAAADLAEQSSDAELNRNTYLQSKLTEVKYQNSEARKKIDELETQSKIEQAERGAALLSNISELIGKDTAAGKVAAVAATTINTYAAAQAAFLNAQKNPISILGPAYPYISAGLAIAGGLKNVQAILSVPTPSGSGGSSTGGVTSAPPSAPPQFNVVGTSGTNQIAQTLGNQQPVKAYVVANDVSTQQSLDRNIVKTATIGN